MKAIVSAATVAIFLAQRGGAADRATQKPQRPPDPKFVIYSAAADAELGGSLFRVLRGTDQVSRLAKAETIEKALESPAGVLVLVMPGRTVPKLEKETLGALKKRKIVGIGIGAAQLFGQMGLEINGGACAHGFKPPTIKIMPSVLLGKPKGADPIPALVESPEPEPEPGAARPDVFGLFAPPRGQNADAVDVLARWTASPNYASAVRQGNCVLIGLPVPATQWTIPYAEFVRTVCQALSERPLEPFSTARRELTRPGTYEFKLARRGSTDEPFDRKFYFRFSEPTKFTARLEHSGSNSVMLLFMGESEQRLHWTRRDARQDGNLEITADISREDIADLGDRHWMLGVTNFGAQDGLSCKLTITIEKP